MAVVGQLRVTFSWDYGKTIDHLLQFDAALYLLHWDYMFGEGKTTLGTGWLSKDVDRDLRRFKIKGVEE